MRYLFVSLIIALFSSGPVLADQTAVFKSPSGNIFCQMSVGEFNGVRCDILDFQASYNDPACELDYGFAFEVASTGPGYPLCAGDTVNDGSNAVLNYGQQFTHGSVTCVSEKSGVTCKNPSGHGFSLSRARQRVF